MIFHENCLPTDNSHEVQTLFVIFEKGQNLKLSTAANYSGALRVKWENFEKLIF